MLNLNRYSLALDCLKGALVFESQCNGNLEVLNGLIEKCKKLDYLSITVNFDISNWLLCGFSGICPNFVNLWVAC